MKNQIEKQVDALKPLNLSNKIEELKQIETIFPIKQLNDLIMQLQYNIKLDDLEYTTKRKTF